VQQVDAGLVKKQVGTLPLGPKSVEEGMQYGKVYLERLQKVFGAADICARICCWSWHLSSTFTGASCCEVAASSLAGHFGDFLHKHGTKIQQAQYSKKCPLSFGYCADFEKAPQQMLKDTYADSPRCVFTDVTKWLNQDGTFTKQKVECLTHGRCHLPVADDQENKVDASGPPCVMFSKAGKGLGIKDKRYKCHRVYQKHRQERCERLGIFENVKEFPIELIVEAVGDRCDVLHSLVDPRRFGYAAARPRQWALILDKVKAQWDSTHSFDEMLDMMAAAPVMHAKDCQFSCTHMHLHSFNTCTVHCTCANCT
jgi:hypothetical protein